MKFNDFVEDKFDEQYEDKEEQFGIEQGGITKVIMDNLFVSLVLLVLGGVFTLPVVFGGAIIYGTFVVFMIMFKAVYEFYGYKRGAIKDYLSNASKPELKKGD